MAEAAESKKGLFKRTIIIIVVILILLASGVAVYYFFFSDNAKKKKLQKAADKAKQDSAAQQAGPKEPAQSSPAASQTSAPRPGPSGNDNWPLQKGSAGDRVLYLKRAINRLLPIGYTKLTESPEFDQPVYAYLLTQFGTAYYPVTQDKWMEIMKKSNAPIVPAKPPVTLADNA